MSFALNFFTNSIKKTSTIFLRVSLALSVSKVLRDLLASKV